MSETLESGSAWTPPLTLNESLSTHTLARELLKRLLVLYTNSHTLTGKSTNKKILDDGFVINHRQ